MANEIQFPGAATGATHYFIVRNAIGQPYDSVTGAFQAYLTANYSGYVNTTSEQGANSNYYVGNFPSIGAASGGIFNVVAKRQTGANPAESDPNVATNEFHWNGSLQVPQAHLTTSGQLGQAIPIRLARGIAVSGFPVFFTSNADHVTPFTSGVISGQISRDGGGFGALQSGLVAGAYSEVGLGHYRVNLTSGDLNASVVILNFQAVGISGGAADPVNMVLFTQRTSGN